MTAEERQHRIEAYLMKVEFASLEELAQHTGASVSSVRRDVTALEAKGHIRRTHGGARLTNPRSDEFAFSNRDTQQLTEKEQIARACAALIGSNQTVIVDAGTTCFHVARHLDQKTLHIVTNSLPVAQHSGSSQRIEVVVGGGVIYPRFGVLVGPLAVDAFSRVRADIAVMSCGGITPDGVMNSHGLLIDIQRAMMRAARRVILCVDHTKFGRQSISRLCGIESIDTLVTTQTPPPEILAALDAAEVQVIVASHESTVVLREGVMKPRRQTTTPVDPVISISAGEIAPAPTSERTPSEAPVGLDDTSRRRRTPPRAPRRAPPPPAAEVFADRDAFID